MANTKKHLVLIDGNALVHRAYHALPPLTTKKGELVNAVYGFLLVLFKAIKDFRPDFIVATFDVPGLTFRHEKFEKYKAKRVKAPDELYNQIPKVKEILKSFSIPFFEKAGYEADDLIATIATQVPKKQILPKIETIIVTGDSDTLQLINENTKVFALRRGVKDTVLYDEAEVSKKYDGLNPGQLPDFKGLVGDASDNIPGVIGVGEKTATELIKKFGSLENIYKEIEENTEKSKEIKESLRKKLLDYKEQAVFSKELNLLKKNVDINLNLKEAVWGSFNIEKVINILKEFEFHSLISRLSELSEEKNKNKLVQLEIGGGRNILEDIEKMYQEKIFSKKIYEIEKNLVPVIEGMEKNGIKIDLERFKRLSKNLEIRIRDLEEKIYEISGMKFNINSPQQLSEILFKRLEIKNKGMKKTPGGVVSTSFSELEKIKNSHPIIKLILEYRELFKLKSGFIDTLPTMIKKDGRIHPNFHQLGTVSGRLSCSEPNLQNIPVKGDLGKEIRKAFVAEKGYKLLSFDYSQMELRVVASIADDKKMIRFFQEGKDIHRMTASQIFNVPEAKVTEKMRDFAKTLNFGVIYGISSYGFSEAAKISFEEAESFIEEYLNDFQGIAKYREEAIEKTKKLNYTETLFGRKRFLPEINSLDRTLKNAAERVAINHPCQGTAADILKMVMVKIKSQIPIADNKTKLVLQIHDELLFEVKEKEIEAVTPKIKKSMENITELKIPLKVDVKIGENWGEMESANINY